MSLLIKKPLCFFDENDNDHKTNLGNKPINQLELLVSIHLFHRLFYVSLNLIFFLPPCFINININNQNI